MGQKRLGPTDVVNGCIVSNELEASPLCNLRVCVSRCYIIYDEVSEVWLTEEREVRTRVRMQSSADCPAVKGAGGDADQRKDA